MVQSLFWVPREFFRIQSFSSVTLTYTPGYSALAQPQPQLTTPICVSLQTKFSKLADLPMFRLYKPTFHFQAETVVHLSLPGMSLYHLYHHLQQHKARDYGKYVVCSVVHKSVKLSCCILKQS